MKNNKWAKIFEWYLYLSKSWQCLYRLQKSYLEGWSVCFYCFACAKSMLALNFSSPQKCNFRGPQIHSTTLTGRCIKTNYCYHTFLNMEGCQSGLVKVFAFIVLLTQNQYSHSTFPLPKNAIFGVPNTFDHSNWSLY